jgi:hypothetical protein
MQANEIGANAAEIGNEEGELSELQAEITKQQNLSLKARATAHSLKIKVDINTPQAGKTTKEEDIQMAKASVNAARDGCAQLLEMFIPEKISGEVIVLSELRPDTG